MIGVIRMNAAVRRPLLLGAAVALVLIAGSLLRGWLIPADRGGLAPEAYRWRLHWPWTPSAEVSLAFPLPDGSAWATVRRSVPEATPLHLLRELAAGPSPASGLKAVLPAGAQVAAVDLEAGTVTVQVQGWSPMPADPAIPLALRAMARALSGMADEVQIRADSGLLGAAAVATPAPTQVAYLWQGLPVFVPVALPDGPERPAAAVQRLLDGPVPVGVDPMPSGVRLASVQVKGDVARIALDLAPEVVSELVAGRWQFAPSAMAMVYTLTEQPGIRRVQFDFPNLPAEARRNCRTPLGVPLARPDAERMRAKAVAP